MGDTAEGAQEGITGIGGSAGYEGGIDSEAGETEKEEGAERQEIDGAGEGGERPEEEGQTEGEEGGEEEGGGVDEGGAGLFFGE